MKRSIFYLLPLFFVILLLSLGRIEARTDLSSQPTLKDAYKDKFYIGTALNRNQYLGVDTAAQSVIIKNFSAIVPENCMKSESLQPKQEQFFFDDADKFVEFGLKNNLFITGHTLIWHSQTPSWFFVDEKGNDVTRDVLIQRMKNHIQTVVGRYKGKVKGWDVVNEAILDDGNWRQSKFYKIIGEEFISLAFQFAHEADPNAELYYNDYSMALPKRRNAVISMVKSLQAKGIKINGIGMQGHVDLTSPSLVEFEKSIVEFSALGVKVMITEFDLSALPSPWGNVGANISDAVKYQEKMNPYPKGLPAEVEAQWDNRMLDFFTLFLKHSDKISRVTFWGVNDAQSWKNDFPVRGRTDYPLLFDRNYKKKQIISKLINAASIQSITVVQK